MSHVWANKLPTFCSPAQDMTASPLACYTAFLARRRGNQQLLAASRQLYTRGLLDVQHALLDNGSALTDATLAACLSLITYEALECPDANAQGYYWHNEGCSRLVEMRGPRKHQDGIGHDLFLEYRIYGAGEALRLHKPNFLCTPTWLTLPWQKTPKSRFDKLLDILLLAPAILSKAATFHSTPASQLVSLISSLADDLWTVDVKLDEFYEELHTHHPGPLYTSQPSSSAIIVDRVTPVPSWRTTALTFPTPEIARILSLFWALQAMVWNGLRDLNTGACEMEFSDFLPPLDHLRDMKQPIRKILQSVEYWNSSPAVTFGPARVALSLNIIVDTMEGKADCNEEQAWARMCQREIGDNMLKLVKYASVNPWVLKS